MYTSKKLLIAGLAIATVASAGLFAHSAVALGGSELDNFAYSIATKYNLNQGQVRVTLDKFRQQQLVQRETVLAVQLDQAVVSGALSVEQKNKILAERAYLKLKLEGIKGMRNAATRKTALRQLFTDIKQWATSNSVPLRWLRASGYAGMGLVSAS